jgi:CubicO group peptidase (beta-lactamase class C family)
VTVSRRLLLGAGLAAATSTLTGCGGRTRASWSTPGAAGSAAPGQILAGPTPSGSAGASGPPGTVASAPYAAPLTATLKRYLVPTPENPSHPGYAGAVGLVTVNGVVTVHTAVGDALRYAAGPVELPPAKRVAMRPDSIFDLASITKVFTAVLALQQVDRGRLDLAAPVVHYLPEFTGTGKAAVTVSMLLAHTSGLPVGPNLSTLTSLSTLAERRAAVLATPLVPGAVAGNTFRYSSTGIIVLGQILERLTGLPLDQLLRTALTGPLGLRETGFTPPRWLAPAESQARMVATDARTSRGLLRGVVHDQVADVLGGIAGHAGIFSTARDLAVIGGLLLNGGTYGGKRILSESIVARMLTNANPGLPAIDAERPNRTSTHGLGVELDQPWFMGRLSSLKTFGHTGFTGTSILVEPRRRLVLVLLTNRAHPNWSWANPDPTRAAAANVIAAALP